MKMAVSEHRTRTERQDDFLSLRSQWWAVCSCGWAARADSMNEAKELAESHEAGLESAKGKA